MVNFIRSLVVFSALSKIFQLSLKSSLIFKHNVLFFFFFGILSFSKKEEGRFNIYMGSSIAVLVVLQIFRRCGRVL